jgi:hypothetical protein
MNPGNFKTLKNYLLLKELSEIHFMFITLTRMWWEEQRICSGQAGCTYYNC